MKLVGLLASVLALSSLVVACAAEPESDEEQGSTESSLTGTRNVSLKYEGTCEFLRTCSTYSKNLPAGKVTWGCTGVGMCSDSALWVAAPNRSYCGKSVQFCKGGKCTTALVKDVSVSRDWEASNGVLDALGLPHGLSGKCGGYGGGAVTMEVGGKSVAAKPEADDDAADEPKAAAKPDADDGCFSATLQKDVAELACVTSASTGVTYQCKAGKWYRGVEDGTGPYGACAK